MRFIVYPDAIVDTPTPEDWVGAPDDGVQVVGEHGAPDALRWTCDGEPIRDRMLWTGEDEYDPFGWGVKYGAWLSDEAYAACWRRACGYH